MAITHVFSASLSEGDDSITTAAFDVLANDLVVVGSGTGYGNDVTSITLSNALGLTQLAPNDSGFASFNIRQRVYWGQIAANFTGLTITDLINLGGNPHTLNVSVYRPDAGETWTAGTPAMSVTATPYVMPSVNISGKGVVVAFYSEQFNSTAVAATIGGTELTRRAFASVTLQAAAVWDRITTGAESNIGGDTVSATDGRAMLYIVPFTVSGGGGGSTQAPRSMHQQRMRHA